MGLLSRLLGRRAAPAPVTKSTPANPQSWFTEWIFDGQPTASGINITPESAMRAAAVWACVRALSEDIAKLPVILFRRLPGGGKERADDHPLMRVIRQPNRRHTPFEFMQIWTSAAIMRGNGFAWQERGEDGRAVAVWPLDPKQLEIRAGDDGDLVFFYGPKKVQLFGEDVLHLRDISLDGVLGLSAIGQHRETIGLTIAAETYGASFFGNNAAPRGAVKIPVPVGDQAVKMLRDSWERRHRGAENAHRLAVLDGGMEFQAIGLTNEDAQYLESRQFQSGEIARIFRVPPHKIGDLTKATFSNIEHQALEYVSDSLMPWITRIEQRLDADLLMETEQNQYFFKFQVDGLLRGDMKTRYEAYAIGRNWGWLSANDVRAMENQNPVEDGDIYLQPLNMVEAGSVGDDVDPPAAAPAPEKPEPQDPEVQGE